ncbi:MAG: DUF3846 domain-containing protein [Clostridia bacterium]|nr:DUF3846 domain-containing protein [Clostridia bacterium]
MNRYYITLKEVREKEVSVVAESREQAAALVRAQMRNGTINMDSVEPASTELTYNGQEKLDLENVYQVLFVPVGREPEVRLVGRNLEDMQDAIRGYIEAVYFSDDPVVLICNEEGKLENLSLNRAIKDEYGNVIDIIAGDFFIVGTTDDDFCDLSPELMKKYRDMFRCPETFLRLGNKVVAIPHEPDYPGEILPEREQGRTDKGELEI